MIYGVAGRLELLYIIIGASEMTQLIVNDLLQVFRYYFKKKGNFNHLLASKGFLITK